MIVVTGATGALNGATVDHLLEPRARRPSSPSPCATPPGPPRFADRGVEVRRGDYADPASLPAAFAGADQLLLVSSNDPGADAVALHRAAIDAAVAAGVGRILYTSHQGAAPDSPFAPARDHAATEELLAASGLAWTSLRNGFYAHSLHWLRRAVARDRRHRACPADGPVSWTAREDAAEAAAVVLASGRRVRRTGHAHRRRAAPTFAEVAAIASELTGRPVERRGRRPGGVARRPGRRRAAGARGPLHPRHLPGRRAGALRGHRPAAGRPARPRAADGRDVLEAPLPS